MVAEGGGLTTQPRYVLHSAVTGPDSGEGELKLYGSAAGAAEQQRSSAGMVVELAGRAILFALRLDQGVVVSWETGHGVMTIDRWSPHDGYGQHSRTYP